MGQRYKVNVREWSSASYLERIWGNELFHYEPEITLDPGSMPVFAQANTHPMSVGVHPHRLHTHSRLYWLSAPLNPCLLHFLKDSRLDLHLLRSPVLALAKPRFHSMNALMIHRVARTGSQESFCMYRLWFSDTLICLSARNIFSNNLFPIHISFAASSLKAELESPSYRSCWARTGDGGIGWSLIKRTSLALFGKSWA